jgi:two-component system, chemotaxis family, chemotaxis protein CheV
MATLGIRNNIPLESSTNEVEFIEFYVKKQGFGINVAKVREIIQYNQDAVTWIAVASRARP